MTAYRYHLNVILLFCSARIATVNQEKDVCTQPFKKKDPHLKHDLVLPQKVKFEPAALAQQRSGTRTTSTKLRGNIKENTVMAELFFCPMA